MSLTRRTRKPQQPQPLPFTETQIRERAYILWQADPEGSAESHWEAAIEELQRERSLVWQVGQSWQTAFNSENRDFSLDVLKFVVSSFGVLATIFAGAGLYLTYRNSQAQIETAQQERQINNERLVTDRFAKAVEQLGNGTIDVRIGAIYSLERIAKDSPKDHWTIMEVLIAFVKNRSPLPKDWTLTSQQKLPNVTADVQAALTVLGRRDTQNDPKGKRIDLQDTNLSGADLSQANLDIAFFDGADLSSAILVGTSFNRALLLRVKFSHAILSATTFHRALLSQSNFNDAWVDNADFTGAKYITPTQIKRAKDWQDAHYDPDFRQQLGLPPEKTSP